MDSRRLYPFKLNKKYLGFTVSSSVKFRSDGRTANGVGVGPLAFWDCKIESRQGHGCLSLMGVACCLFFSLITRPEESYQVWCA